MFCTKTGNTVAGHKRIAKHITAQPKETPRMLPPSEVDGDQRTVKHIPSNAHLLMSENETPRMVPHKKMFGDQTTGVKQIPRNAHLVMSAKEAPTGQVATVRGIVRHMLAKRNVEDAHRTRWWRDQKTRA